MAQAEAASASGEAIHAHWTRGVPFDAFAFADDGKYVEFHGNNAEQLDAFVRAHPGAQYRDGKEWHR